MEILGIKHSEVQSEIKGVRHQLKQPVQYVIVYFDQGITKYYVGSIKKDYRFSASIPWGFYWVVGHPLDDEFRVPSLIHDDLCDKDVDGYLRDRAFRFLLRKEGLDKRIVRIMYKAVVQFRKAKTKVKGWF